MVWILIRKDPNLASRIQIENFKIYLCNEKQYDIKTCSHLNAHNEKVQLPDEDTMADLYIGGVERLQSAGLKRNEMSGHIWISAKLGRLERFRVFASPARKHFDDARRATAENDTIVKDAKISRHVRPWHKVKL